MFISKLKQELAGNIGNRYTDNYDAYRFGPERVSWTRRLRRDLTHPGLYRSLLRCPGIDRLLLTSIRRYLKPLEFFYDRLADDESRQLLCKIVAFRVLGHTRVKLPLNTPEYWSGIQAIEILENRNDSIEAQFINGPIRLNLIEFDGPDPPIRMYFTARGGHTTFGTDHYSYKDIVAAGPGDTVLDLGGCYGDTALYFAQRVGPGGRVFSFEFIPGNCAVLEQNLQLNPALRERIQLIKQPAWNESGTAVYFRDRGPGSQVALAPFDGMDGETATLAVDDLVREQGIDRVHFIKTDIEGAEPYALRGAETTIRRWQPRLAISIYHNMSDFVEIVRYLHELKLGYEFFLGHASIHGEETVLFARVAG